MPRTLKDAAVNLFPALLDAIGTLAKTFHENPMGAAAIIVLVVVFRLGKN